MAVDRAIVCSQVAFTSTADIAVLVGGVQRVLLRTITNDCYVDFDQPVAATQSARLIATDTSYIEIAVKGGSIQNVHVKGVSGSGTLFVIAIID